MNSEPTTFQGLPKGCDNYQTASIEVEPPDSESEDMITVYMDVHVGHKPMDGWGAECDFSDPYVLIGKGTKVKAFLTPVELKRLEEAAQDLGNGMGCP